MSSDKEKDEYNVISDNNEYALESNGEEIIYEEYIDADQIVEGYTEDGKLVYYTEDGGVYEEIVLGDDSDIIYEEIVYEDKKAENSEDIVFVEEDKEPEKVILGDGSDEENKVEKKSVSKKVANGDLKKKQKDKEEKRDSSKDKAKPLKNDSVKKEVLDKEIANSKDVTKDDIDKDTDVNAKTEGITSDNVDTSSNNNVKVDSVIKNELPNDKSIDNNDKVQSNNNVNNNVQLNNNVQNNNTNNVEVNSLNKNVQSNNVVPNNNISNGIQTNVLPESKQANEIVLNNNINNNVQLNNNSQNNNTNNVEANSLNENVQSNNVIPNNNISNGNVLPENKYPNEMAVNNNVQRNNNVSNVQSNNIAINSNVNSNSAQLGYNNQNTIVSKSVFTQEERASLVSDENARLASTNGQVNVANNTNISKGVPVVEINLENSKSSLNNSVFNGAGYTGNSAIPSNQPMPNGGYQIPRQINNPGMMPQATMVYQNQMPTMRPMNNYAGTNQQFVAQPQIINSQPMPYQNPVMTQSYQSAIPVATSGVVPPSNMNYQANAQQMMQPVNTSMMYQANSGVYGAQAAQQIGQQVYPNNVMPQVPRVNPYQAMKPAVQANANTNNKKNSSDKSIYKKNHGFLKFLFFLIFLAIAGLVVYILFFRESNYNGKANLNSLYDPLKLIPVYDGKLLGYTNYKGEFVIEPAYSSGSDFYGNYAVVSKDEKYKIIDKEGQQIVAVNGTSIPFYDDYYDVWIVDDKLYGNEMNLLFSNIKDVSNGFYSYIDSTKGEVGIVNNTGKILYSCAGTSISFETMETFFNDSYALVKVEGNDDVIISSATGKIVYKGLGINIKDNNIFSLNFNGITKYFYVYGGKVVKEFDGVSDVSMFNFSKRILQVTNADGSNFYYDTINNFELTTAESGELFYAEEYYGYEIIKKESESAVKYDLIKNGESVLDMTYDSISFLEPALHEFVKIRTLKEFVILTIGDTVKLYDLTFKKTVVELQNVDVTYGGTFIIFTAKKDTSNKEDIIYNLLTNMQTTFTTGEKEYIPGSNYVIAVDKNNNASYYNIKVKNIHETSDFSR